MSGGRWLLAASFALLVVATALRVTGPSDLWDDAQPRTIGYTTDILVNGRWVLPVLDGAYPARKPPLYNWLAAPAVRVGGFASEFAHTFPSVLAMWLMWAGIAWCVARFAGADDEALALAALASTLFVANHLTFKLGYLARPDMVLSALLLAGWWAVTRMIVRPPSPRDRARAAAFWICVGLAALAKGPAAGTLVLYALIALPVLTGQWRSLGRLGWWWGLPLAAVLFGAWVAAAWRIDAEHVVRTLWYEEFWGRVTGLGPEGAREGSSALLTGAADMLIYYALRFAPWSLLTLPAPILLWLRRRQRSDLERVMAGAWWFVVVTIVAYTLSAGKRGDYVAGAVAPAAVLVAWWIVEITRRRTAWRWVAVVTAFVVVGVIAAKDRSEPDAPAPGLGDEMLAWTRDARTLIDTSEAPLAMGWMWESPLPALLGHSGPLHDDPLAALEVTGVPAWLVAGEVPGSPAARIAGERPDLHVRLVLHGRVLPNGTPEPAAVGLYRIEAAADR
jgi:4-amino-4-deoxy-L-arabinose transferase-like glycosyltransferase